MTSFSKIRLPGIALLRDLPRPAAVGVFLFFIAGLADGVLMPFFALWAHGEAGVPLEYIGLLLGCYAGGELLATPFLGGIADRLGRRPVLLVSTTGVGIGFLLLYLTHGVLAAAIALIVIGVFESVLHPTAATVIADVAPEGQMRRHFALMRVASNVGHIAGPAAGAFLVHWSLGLVFVGSGLAMLSGAAVVAALLPETRLSNASVEDEDEDGLGALAAALRDRRLAALLLPVAIVEVTASWIEAVLPLFATGAGTLTPAGVGLLFSYAGAFSALFQLPIVHVSSRLSSFSIVMISGFALMLAFGCLLASAGLPLLIAGVTLAAVAQMLAGPLTQALATALAPANARATYMAAFSAVNDLKDAAGPAVGTWLYAISAGLPWVIGMPVAVIAATMVALVARRHEGAALAES